MSRHNRGRGQWEDEPNYEKIRRRSGKKEIIHELFQSPDLWSFEGGSFAARVVEVHKRYVFVSSERALGDIDTKDVWLATVAKKYLTNQRQERNFVTVGDRVLCSPVSESEKVTLDDLPQCVIQQAAIRENQIYRTDPLRDKRNHILASNLDQLMLVASIVNPGIKWGFLDRMLLIAEEQEIPAVLVFNKFDLAKQFPSEFALAMERISYYQQLGYDFLNISAGAEDFKNSDQFQQLRALTKDKITLIAGQSGVGKSSLVNRFDPEIIQAVEDNPDIFYKGRHTTSFASFLRIGPKSYLIDTPGVKGFGIRKKGPASLAYGFRDFRPHLSHCQYRECSHTHEPICEVRAAVEKKQIADWRYKSYLGIYSGESGREGRAGQIDEG
jgi:ribosome biogenesis GTPase